MQKCTSYEIVETIFLERVVRSWRHELSNKRDKPLFYLYFVFEGTTCGFNCRHCMIMHNVDSRGCRESDVKPFDCFSHNDVFNNHGNMQYKRVQCHSVSQDYQCLFRRTFVV